MLSRHHPRKRVIQYSRDAGDESRSRSVLDARPREHDGFNWSGTTHHPLVVPAHAGIYRVACQAVITPFQGWPDLNTALAKTTRRRSTAMRATLGGFPLAMSRS